MVFFALTPRTASGLTLSGAVLEGFETGAAGWFNFQATGALADDTTHVLNGLHSLKMTTPAGGGVVGAQKLLETAADVSRDEQFRVYFYVWEDDPGTYVTQCDVRLATSNDFANAWNATPTLAFVHKGWNVLLLDRSDFTPTGSPSWASPIVGVRLKVGSAGKPLSVSFDSIWTGCKEKGVVSFTFDDEWDSQYTEAYRYMSAKGLVGAVAVVPDLVGVNGRCTLGQLQEMYGAGWDMLNHTYDHQDLTTLTDARIGDEVRSCASYLQSSGMPRGAWDLAYPSGQFDQRVITAATAAGMRSGLTVNSGYEALPLVDSSAVDRCFLYNTTTLAQAKSLVDGARTRGGWVIISGHSFVADDPGPIQWRTSDFEALVDYVAASGIPVVPYTVPLVPGTCRLHYNAGANGSIAGVADQTLPIGSTGTSVTAVPGSGYRFAGWSDGLTTATRCDTGVVAYLSVTASFAPSPAGSMTGDGNIESSRGAYVAAPRLTGLAHFHFDAKYEGGVPYGSTDFRFSKARLDFHSKHHEWLVISSRGKAEWECTGTVNGKGDYRVRVTAIDGSPLRTFDTFRIQIWNNADAKLIYDNTPSAPNGNRRVRLKYGKVEYQVTRS